MKKAFFTLFLLCSLGFLFGQQPYTTFEVSSITLIKTVSHERVRMTFNGGGEYFPYPNQIGWRIYFSRYPIGWQDPQYEYVVWNLPNKGFDIAQELWFVRPIGLTGTWYYRVDAVDTYRTAVATSNEQIFNFWDIGSEGTTYSGVIPWYANDPNWKTSFNVLNPTNETVDVKFKYYSTSGGLVEVIKTIQPRKSVAEYIPTSLNYGYVVLESTAPCTYIFLISTTGITIPVYGELK